MARNLILERERFITSLSCCSLEFKNERILLYSLTEKAIFSKSSNNIHRRKTWQWWPYAREKTWWDVSLFYYKSQMQKVQLWWCWHFWWDETPKPLLSTISRQIFQKCRQDNERQAQFCLAFEGTIALFRITHSSKQRRQTIYCEYANLGKMWCLAYLVAFAATP